MAAVSCCSLLVRVSRVEASAEVPLVRLWVSVEERPEEHSGQEEEKWTPKVGKLCLAYVGGVWQRCKVLKDASPDHSYVLLLDFGGSLTSVKPDRLRQAPSRAFFPFPSHEVAGVIGRLAPPAGQKWPYSALSYFQSLNGQQLKGQLQDVLLPQGLLLLDLPEVVNHLLSQGLAATLPDQSFSSMLGCPSALLNMSSTGPAVAMDFYYPDLQIGLMEPVLVTYVGDPQRVFCQLRSMSREVQRLSDSMQNFYETHRAGGGGDASFQQPIALGQPCASRSTNGRWYRSLLQQFYPERQLALVIHVDWGFKDLVPLKDLRTLAPEFFRMPVMTYRCAMYGVFSCEIGWEPSLIYELRSLLLTRHLNAKIEFYNSYEHLYVVTLLAEDGLNLNSFYGLKVQNLKASVTKLSLAPPAHKENGVGMVLAKLQSTGKSTAPEENGVQMDVLKTQEQKCYVSRFVTVELKIGTFYDTTVEFVLSPYCFWIRTAESTAKHKEVVDHITSLYSSTSKLEGILTEPKLGQACCVKFQDVYYRAEVVTIEGKKIHVYLVDCGNMKVVDWLDVKELPMHYRALPALANRCCLADVFSLGDTWSPEAVRAFEVAVTDKKLVVYIVSKDYDKYTIEVFDQSRILERNVGKMLAAAQVVRYEEPETDSMHLEMMESGTVCRLSSSQPVSVQTLSQQKRNVEFLNEDNLDETLISPFEDQLFAPGTTFSVTVSHIESPGLFWCQKASQRSSLNNLMRSIQTYCSSANYPYESGSLVCLAKSPANGLWYRGLISEIPARKAKKVEVLYVDYGIKETLPVDNLLAMQSDFFHLQTQAFKCSLYNMITPIGTNPFHWDSKATDIFWDFVNEASKGSECNVTIYAVASVDGEQFNIVDLHTPFKSLCTTMVEKGFAAHLFHETLASSVQLQSFYYSFHNFSLGKEEIVHITHVSPSLEFYCQLSKNTNAVEKISHAIAKTLEKTQHLKLPCPGPLCLAKFTDEQWYRGIMSSDSNGIEVFFVDFGNTEKVEKDDLLPIGCSDYDLLLQPMQAIKCSLPDIPTNVSSEILSWFENATYDKALKAVTVAKPSDEKFMVELYDSDNQINAILKKKLGIKESKIKHTCKTGAPAVVEPADRGFRGMKNVFYKIDTNTFSQEKSNTTRETYISMNRNSQAPSDHKPNTKYNLMYPESSSLLHYQESNSLEQMTDIGESKVRLTANRGLERFYERNPLKSKTDKSCSSKSQESTSQSWGTHTRESNISLKQGKSTVSRKPEQISKRTETPFEHKAERKSVKYQETYSEVKFRERKGLPPLQNGSQVGISKSRLVDHQDLKIYGGEPSLQKTLPVVTQHGSPPSCRIIKLSDLPRRQILPGTKLPVYVSHANGFYDFYVQMADSSLLDDISEILSKKDFEVLNEKDIHEGDVVCAYFCDDELYYRGVVIEKGTFGLKVEYIDYGNTSTISDCKTYRLPEKLCSFYVMSIQCSLHRSSSTDAAASTEQLLNTFFIRTSDFQLDCEFVKLHDGKWDVILYDDQGCINDLLTTSFEIPLVEEGERAAPQQYVNQVNTKDFDLEAGGTTVLGEANAMNDYSEYIPSREFTCPADEQGEDCYTDTLQSELTEMKPSCEQVLPCICSSSLESLILQFNEKLVLIPEERSFEDVVFKGNKNELQTYDRSNKLEKAEENLVQKTPLDIDAREASRSNLNCEEVNNHGHISESIEADVLGSEVVQSTTNAGDVKKTSVKKDEVKVPTYTDNLETFADEEGIEVEAFNYLDAVQESKVITSMDNIETVSLDVSEEDKTAVYMGNVDTIAVVEVVEVEATTFMNDVWSVESVAKNIANVNSIKGADGSSVNSEEDIVPMAIAVKSEGVPSTFNSKEANIVDDFLQIEDVSNMKVQESGDLVESEGVLYSEGNETTMNAIQSENVLVIKHIVASVDCRDYISYEEDEPVKDVQENDTLATRYTIEGLEAQHDAGKSERHVMIANENLTGNNLEVAVLYSEQKTPIQGRKFEHRKDDVAIHQDNLYNKKCVEHVAHIGGTNREDTKTDFGSFCKVECKVVDDGERLSEHVAGEPNKKEMTVIYRSIKSENVKASSYIGNVGEALVEETKQVESTKFMDNEGVEDSNYVDYEDDLAVEQCVEVEATTYFSSLAAEPIPYTDKEERQEVDDSANVDAVFKERELVQGAPFVDYENIAPVEKKEDVEVTKNVDSANVLVQQREKVDAATFMNYAVAVAVGEREEIDDNVFVDHEDALAVEEREELKATIFSDIEEAKVRANTCMEVGEAVEETEAVEATTNVDYEEAVVQQVKISNYVDNAGAIAVKESREVDLITYVDNLKTASFEKSNETCACGMLETVTVRSFCEIEEVEDNFAMAMECQNLSSRYAVASDIGKDNDSLQMEGTAFKNIMESNDVEDRGKTTVASAEFSKNGEDVQIRDFIGITKSVDCRDVLHDTDGLTEDDQGQATKAVMEQLKPKHCEDVGDDHGDIMNTVEKQKSDPKISGQGNMQSSKIQRNEQDVIGYDNCTWEEQGPQSLEVSMEGVSVQEDDLLGSSNN